MKQLRLLILPLLLLLTSNITWGQTTVTIGTGTVSSTTYGPIYRSSATSTFDFSRCRYVYTAAELAAVGILPGAEVSSLAWNKTTTFGMAGTGNAIFKVYAKNTAATTATNETWANITTGATLVVDEQLSTSKDLPLTTGWWTLQFTTPFTYTGGSLEIAVDWDCFAIVGNPSTGAFNWAYSTAPATRTSYSNNSTQPTSTATTTTIRPNIQLTYTNAVLTCPPISGLSAAPTATSVTLAWTAGGSETAWDIEYGLAGFTQGTGTVVTSSSTTTTISGLSPASNYQAYVRANCGGGDESFWTSVSFATPCVTFAAPFNQNFDGLPLVSPFRDLPTCWAPQVGPDYWTVTNDLVNTGHTYLPNIGDHTTGTGNYMWIDASSDILANAMETPMIDMGALTTPYAGFWFASNNTNNAINHTVALDAWNGTAWVNLVTQTGNFSTWVEVGAAVPSSIPTVTKFRIYAIANPAGTSSDYFYNDLGVDDFFVIEAPTCITPVNLTASNIGTTTAVLNWTSMGTAWDIEWGALGFSPGTGTLVSGIAKPYTLNGLSQNTSYAYYVRTNCGSGSVSAWAGPFSFRTNCAYVSDFTENFDSYVSGNNLPACWDKLGTGSLSLSTTSPASGTLNVLQYSANTFAATTAIMRPVGNINAGTHWLRFRARVSSGTGTLNVGYITDKLNASTFVTVQTVTITNTTYNQETFVSFPNTVPAGAYIAIQNPGTTTASHYWDNVIWEAVPSCPFPVALAGSNVTTSSIDLTWTDFTPATAWQIEYGAPGFTQGTGTTLNVSSKPYTLSGLNAATTYNFYIRTICGTGNSTWEGPFVFTTACPPALNVPYFQGFETGNVQGATVANCLTQASVTGTDTWVANSTLTTYNRTPFAGSWNATLIYSNEDWLFVPLNLTGGVNYTAEVYARQDGATATNSNVAISYGTANTAAGMTNVIVPATGIVNGNYQLLSGTFTPATTGIYYVGIKGFMNSTPWYISLDNIAVYATPLCPKPTALTATIIDSTTATVNWTENAGATTWTIEYGPVGFTQGTGTVINTTTKPYTITGLAPYQDYNFYVRSNCGATGLSDWSLAGSFSTDYCKPAPISVDGQGIVNVTMGTINNATVAEVGNYGNYSSLVTDIRVGTTVDCAITFNTLTYDYNTKIWVDWNNDMDFDDAGEEVYSGLSASTSPNTLYASFVVPVATPLGTYRVRIGGADSSIPTPCYAGSWASFEDYTINVIANPCLTFAASIVSQSDETCLDLNDGAVEVTAPFNNAAGTRIDYTWSDGGTGAIRNNLIPGTYNVIVYHNSRICYDTVIVVINDGPTCYEDACLVNWTNLVGVSYAGTTLTRLSTAAGGWGSGAVSSNMLAAGANGWVSTQAVATNRNRMFGLSPLNILPNNDIAYAIVLTSTGTIQVREGLTTIGTYGTYASGDIFKVERIAGIVTYLRNGVVFYTSATPSTTELYVDCSFNGSTGSLRNTFASFGCAALDPCADFVVTPTVVHETCAGYNNASAALNSTRVHTAYTWSDGSTSASRTGILPGNYTVVASVNGTSCTDTLSLTVNPGLTFPITLTEVLEETCLGEGNASIKVNASRSNTVFYWTDGSIMPVSKKVASRTNLSAGTFTITALDTVRSCTMTLNGTLAAGPLCPEICDITLAGAAGLSVVGNTLTKTLVTTKWDAGARSSTSIAAGKDGWVETGVSSLTGERIVGLSLLGAKNDNNIAYALYLRNGTLQIRQGGVTVGSFGSLAIGDNLKVRRVGTTVEYVRNGSVIYTSLIPSTTALQASLSIKTTGASVSNVRTSFGCLPSDFCDGSGFFAQEVADETCAGANDGYVVINPSMISGTFSWLDNGSTMANRTGMTPGNYLLAFTNGFCYDTISVTINGGELCFPDSCLVNWASLTNVATSGATLTKSNTTSAYDAGATVSANMLAAGVNGWVETEVIETNTRRTFGLSTSNTSVGSTAITYGVQFGITGTMRVIESGTNKGSTVAYAAGDKVRVTRTGNVVTYAKNGVVFYTSTIASTTALYADVSFFTPNATLHNVYSTFGCAPLYTPITSRVQGVNSVVDMVEERVEVSFDNVTVYPNPVLNDFVIDYRNYVGEVKSIEVINMNGQRVRSVMISENGQSTVNTDELESGLYIISINNGAKNIKLVKIRN